MLNGELKQFNANEYDRLALGTATQAFQSSQKRDSYYSNGVNSLVVFPNGNIATTTQEYLEFWDPKGNRIHTCSGKDLGLLTLLPGGRLIGKSANVTYGGYSNYSNPCLTVWDSQGTCIKQLANGAYVSALTVLSAQTIVIAARYPKSDHVEEYSLEVWNIETAQRLKAIKLSQPAHTLAALSEGRVIAAESNVLTVWDISNGYCEQTLTGHTGTISALLTLPNEQVISGSADGTLRIWAIGSGRCIKTLRYSAKAPSEDSGERGVLLGLLPDGAVVSSLKAGGFLSAGGSSTLKLWDIESGRLIQSMNVGDGYGDGIQSLAILPQGGIVIGSAYGKVTRWSTKQRPLHYADVVPFLTFARKHLSGALEILSLANIKLGEEGYYLIFRLLETYKNLRQLDLTDTGLTPEQQNALSKRVSQQANLTVVGLLGTEEKNVVQFPAALFQQPSSHQHIVPLQTFSFNEMFVPPLLPIKKLPPVDKNYECPFTLQIMFDPVMAADGFTYEREAIQKFFNTNPINPLSPITREKFKNTDLATNRNIQSMIQQFLMEHPEYWQDVYFPNSLIKEALTILDGNEPQALLSFLQKYPRFLSMRLGERKTFLLEEITEKGPDKIAIFLRLILAQLKSSDWQHMAAAKPVQEWLQWTSTFCSTHLEIAQAFVEQLKIQLSLTIPPLGFALYALENEDENLFRLAVAQLPDINQVVDKKGNTLLHLAAQKGQSKMVSILSQHGANLKLRNAQGLKAETIARATGHAQTANLFALEKIVPLLHQSGLMNEISQLQQKVCQLETEVGNVKHRGHSFS